MPDFNSSPDTATAPNALFLETPSPDSSVRVAATALIAAVRKTGRERSLSPADYAQGLERLGMMRGQPLAFPLLAGGAGEGAQVQLANGQKLLDFVSGIGPYVFGHDDQDLLETAAIAAAADVVYQGHILPGREYFQLTEALLRHAGPRLEHVWLSMSGSMANENALKMILQRRAPADRVIAFERAFHGRTMAMAELTDRPEYRDGLPLRDFVDRVPFFDPKDKESTTISLNALDRVLKKSPGRIAAFCFELVQGEGGFNEAPAEFFRTLMQRCHQEGIAVWVDEIQTFARSRELFAFKTLGLEEWVDVVTLGKILQGSATLFSQNYRPRPKLVAGTWAGSSVGMAVGARILERLETEGYLGQNGRISILTDRIDKAFADLSKKLPGAITERSGLGLMQAFVPWEGRAEIANEIVAESIKEGVLFQTAGSAPMKIRLLPPLTLTEAEIQSGFEALERALRSVANRHGLPIGFTKGATKETGRTTTSDAGSRREKSE